MVPHLTDADDITGEDYIDEGQCVPGKHHTPSCPTCLGNTYYKEQWISNEEFGKDYFKKICLSDPKCNYVTVNNIEGPFKEQHILYFTGNENERQDKWPEDWPEIDKSQNEIIPLEKDKHDPFNINYQNNSSCNIAKVETNFDMGTGNNNDDLKMTWKNFKKVPK